MALLDSTTPKPDASTGWRTVAPTETLRRVAPYLETVGITRVANVTGLDRIGIPVWQAIRPTSRGLSVSQGKGVDDDSSRASAIMESIEQHHAEFVDLPLRIESYAELSRRATVVDPEGIGRSAASVFTPHLTLPWAAARTVEDDREVWVPFEAVHANTILPRVPGSGSFACNTNGLASGNTLVEAVLHGLCELVERDAHTLWSIGGDATAAATRVDLDTVTAPAARALLDRYDTADIDVALWDMTSDLDIATYRVIITDRQADATFNPVPASYGAGCHPDPVVALARGLTEAAQSRLAAIAGTRDDITRAHYESFRAAASVTSHLGVASDERRPVDAGARASRAADTIEGDVQVVLERIADAGLDPVVFVDLSRDGWPVAVAKTIAPGLEGPSSASTYRAGGRAMAHHQRLLTEASA